MDSLTGLLQGKRVGDKFYRVNGDVLQADHNAARNVLARLYDSEVGRFTSLQGSETHFVGTFSGVVKRHELHPVSGYQPCVD